MTTGDSTRPTSGVTPGFINVLRLLTAASFISGMLSVWRYEFEGIGRLLTAVSVFVAFFGNLAVMQFVKPNPPTWANTTLTVFWLGLIGIGVLWVVALGAGG
jgi:hypothetical protein